MVKLLLKALTVLVIEHEGVNASLHYDQGEEDVVDHCSLKFVQLFWLVLRRRVLRLHKVILRNKEVKDGVTQELQSLIVINLGLRHLMLSHRVEVLLIRFVSHRLDKEVRLLELVANDFLQLSEARTEARHQLLIPGAILSESLIHEAVKLELIIFHAVFEHS